MTSLAEKIATLTNPTPKVLDPEDDVNIETVAKFNESPSDYEAVYSESDLRSKTAPLLEDVDPAYAGKKVSRKSVDNIFQDDENMFSRGNSDYLRKLDGSEENENSDSEDDDELKGSDREHFLNQNISRDTEQSENDVESEESVASDDNETSDDMINKFSNIDVTSEIEKGEAVKRQMELWNRLCECRIYMQKPLINCNQLPQKDYFKKEDEEEKEIKKDKNKASNVLKSMLDTCLKIREHLLNQSLETSCLDNIDETETTIDGNEEILSDTDHEMEVLQNYKEPNPDIKIKSLKRKLKCEEYGDILAKNHKSLIPYRNSVIQKWDEKTRLSSGRVTQKSFSAFDSSALKQIEQILQDENRLIKRTQLKRSLYRVLGKPEVPETQSEESVEGDESASKQDMLLKDHDPEIFDDDDFYRQLLKDIIESKSVGMDPTVLRKQMEIQSVRNKMKRKVDTKASKGRKIRYDVHPKLVNFMAPVKTSTISDEARDSLLKCLFGRNIAKTS